MEMDRILDKLEEIHKDIQELKTSKMYMKKDIESIKAEVKENSEFRWKTKGALVILASMALPPFISFVSAAIRSIK